VKIKFRGLACILGFLLFCAPLAADDAAETAASIRYAQSRADWAAARERYYQAAGEVDLHPRDAAKWIALARAAEYLSKRASLHENRAAFMEVALTARDKAQAISRSADGLEALDKDLRREARMQKLAVDFDLAQAGGGTDRIALDIAPLRFMLPASGWGITVHHFSARMLFDPAQWGHDELQSPRLRVLYDFASVELQKRLWQWSSHSDLPFWAPFYGRGLSLNAYAQACPWALAQGWTYSGGSPLMPGAGTWGLQKFATDVAPAQVYETGLRLDTRDLELAGGYAWMLSKGHSDGRDSFPALQLSGWFVKSELRIF
jgi:hypothetical protein